MRSSSPVALVVTSLTALTLLGLAGCGGSSDDAADPVDGSTSPTGPASPGSPSSPSTPDTPSSPSSPSSPTGGPQTAVPVYYVGDTPTGPRLFREFRSVTGDDPMAAAAALLVTGQTLDPDYRTLLPGGLHVTNVSLSDGKILVEVAADAVTDDPATSAADARLALQQLVYTLDGVSQTHDPVQVVKSDGSSEVPVTLLGIDTSRGVRAASPTSVLSPVNITEPAQGAEVSGTLHASGVALAFEGNVPWQIMNAGGKVVRSGFTTASTNGTRPGPWKTDVDLAKLPAGDYTFVASTGDASGKGEGAVEDTKDFTIS